MLCQITSVLDYPVQNSTSDVQTCFLITATPIIEENENVDIDALFAEGGDISTLANHSNISPFRTKKGCPWLSHQRHTAALFDHHCSKAIE